MAAVLLKAASATASNASLKKAFLILFNFYFGE
jgi:hypothetical protein